MAAETIHRAKVEPSLKAGKSKVTVLTRRGEEKILFSFFADEISFTEDELVGITCSEAHSLFNKKDIAYIQS